MDLTQLSGACTDVVSCPKVFMSDEGRVLVQGEVVEDPAVLARARPGKGEGLVAIPHEVLLQAAEVAKRIGGDVHS